MWALSTSFALMPGPRGRSSYHHGDLRRALIDAAFELAREGGPDAIVVREASRRLGVSHNAAYRHFPDRESLLEAVGERARAELALLMAQLIAETDPGDESLEAARARLAATGRAYVQFAITEPGLFRTGFHTGPGQAPPGHAAAGPVDAAGDSDEREPGPFELLRRALDDLERAGGIAPGARPYAEHVAWSGVHGFSTLSLEGPLRELTDTERDEALAQLFATVERGLAAPRGGG
jgi:AcrR family transcriptional regulator